MLIAICTVQLIINNVIYCFKDCCLCNLRVANRDWLCYCAVSL